MVAVANTPPSPPLFTLQQWSVKTTDNNNRYQVITIAHMANFFFVEMSAV